MNANEIPLGPGDVAIRFRIGYRARKTGGATNYLDVVPVVTGLEAVRILSIDGELVTWTNGREARAGSGQLFRHIGVDVRTASATFAAGPIRHLKRQSNSVTFRRNPVRIRQDRAPGFSFFAR